MKYLIALQLAGQHLLTQLTERRVQDERGGTIVETVTWIAVVLVIVGLVAAAVTAYVNAQIAKIG